MDRYRDTAARARQEARAAEWSVPVAEAGVVIDTLLASVPALARRDFHRVDASTAPPHLCRRVLFARAGVPPSALAAFDAACTAWLTAATTPDAETLAAAAAELCARSTEPLAALSPLAACCAVEAALARAHLAAHRVAGLALYRSPARARPGPLVLATTSLAAARRTAPARRVVCCRGVPPARVLMCHHTNGALAARTRAFVVLAGDAGAPEHLVRAPPATRRERILCALLRVRLYTVQE